LLWCSAVFERGFDYFRTNAAELKEERAMLLEEWLKKELSFGDLGDVTLVQKKAPRKVKRKRPLPSDDGSNIAYALYPVIYSWYCILRSWWPATSSMLCGHVHSFKDFENQEKITSANVCR
jgi:crooked neck